jgi:hypothetical protein
VRSDAVKSRFHCVRPPANRHDRPKLIGNTVLVVLIWLVLPSAPTRRPAGGIRLTALSSSNMNAASFREASGTSGGTVDLGASCGSARARTLMRYALMNQSWAEIVSGSGVGFVVPIFCTHPLWYSP